MTKPPRSLFSLHAAERTSARQRRRYLTSPLPNVTDACVFALSTSWLHIPVLFLSIVVKQMKKSQTPEWVGLLAGRKPACDLVLLSHHILAVRPSCIRGLCWPLTPSVVKFKLDALNSKPIFCRRQLSLSVLLLAPCQRYLFPTAMQLMRVYVDRGINPSQWPHICFCVSERRRGSVPKRRLRPVLCIRDVSSCFVRLAASHGHADANAQRQTVWDYRPVRLHFGSAVATCNQYIDSTTADYRLTEGARCW